LSSSLIPFNRHPVLAYSRSLIPVRSDRLHPARPFSLVLPLDPTFRCFASSSRSLPSSIRCTCYLESHSIHSNPGAARRSVRSGQLSDLRSYPVQSAA
jgi:hypothetical protein